MPYREIIEMVKMQLIPPLIQHLRHIPCSEGPYNQNCTLILLGILS
jgi:hypothetical protein